MAEEPPAPPPAPTFLDEKIAVERIQAIVANARTVWFALIAFLAFIGLTLTSVRDLDFFSATATTQLPIVNIAIPTTTFFWSAAWLAAVLHTYFQLYLIKLWDALAEAPPTIGGVPLGNRVFPWLVVDWALLRRPDHTTTPRPMDWLAEWVTWLLIWTATPLLLALFWVHSMPAHDARLTLAIGLALFFSLLATSTGWAYAWRRLNRPGIGNDNEVSHPPSMKPLFNSRFAELPLLIIGIGALAALPTIAIASVRGAGWHHLPAAVQPLLDALWQSEERLRPPTARADLTGAEIVEKPADWLGRDTAERRFKIGWCQDRGLPPDACQEPLEPYQVAARKGWCATRPIDDCAAEFRRLDDAFALEWREQRGEYLANLTRPDLRGRDLRGASASGAFFAGVDLRAARLEGADLWQAQLEGADLRWARLEGADLRGARLESADLREARLDRANLFAAQLDGAMLSSAGLEGTNLRRARLERADLFSARLGGAILNGAQLERAFLGGARLEGAILSGARLEGADLHEARLERADLFGARLQGANLNEAELSGANFYEARLEGANLYEAQLEAANWAYATFAASPAHSADFTGGRNLTQSQLNKVIGDANTILPLDAETGEQLYVWTCWAEPPPTLDGLLSHWPESEHDRLRAEWLCPPGVAPERTGRPAAPEAATPLAD
jgi:uncharacterized protein YjbI with pentapeptide repeats